MIDVRLLQLPSPSLPVGAFSYSQALEAAVEARVVTDASSAERWIGDVLSLSVLGMEAPVFLRLASAWSAGDREAVSRWNEEFVAARETAELRAETLQMGYSLRRLLRDLEVEGAEALDEVEELAYPAAYAFAIAAWRIDAREALPAYLFAWLEGQGLAPLTAVPLGQTDRPPMLLAP